MFHELCDCSEWTGASGIFLMDGFFWWVLDYQWTVLLVSFLESEQWRVFLDYTVFFKLGYVILYLIQATIHTVI